MSEQTSKSSSKAAPKETGGPQDAPGPISPEHESGTSEQTAAVQKLRDKMQEAQGGPTADELAKLRENPRAR